MHLSMQPPYLPKGFQKSGWKYLPLKKLSCEWKVKTLWWICDYTQYLCPSARCFFQFPYVVGDSCRSLNCTLKDKKKRIFRFIFINHFQRRTVCLQFSCSVVSLCDPMNRSTPGLPVHHQLLEFTQTHVHWVGDAIQSSHPLSSPSPPALNLSQHQGLFRWVSSVRWPKYWSFSFDISPSNEHPGLISFRMGWLDLLAVQGILKSLL